MSKPKDIAAELGYQAAHAGRVEVQPTSPEIVRRYRETRNWRIFRKEYVFHLIHRCNPASVCDFGCGTGETCAELALLGFRATGFDLSPENIQLARRRAEIDGVANRVQLFAADASSVGVPGGSFDLVLVQAVLHHMDMREGIAKIHDLLKPGGLAIVQEPIALSRMLQWTRDRLPVEKDISPNERQLTQADLRILTEKFEILETRYFHLLTRLCRLLPESRGVFRIFTRSLYWLDYFMLHIPGLNRFAGVVVLLCRKR